MGNPAAVSRKNDFFTRENTETAVHQKSTDCFPLIADHCSLITDH